MLNNKTITLDDIYNEIEEMISLIELQKEQTKKLEDMILALEERIKKSEAH